METLAANIEQIIRVNPLLAFVVVFFAGVTVSFTPCVYPVIPITLGYIGAKSAGQKGRGFFLSLVYVCGMAVTYAVLGAMAAFSGKLFGSLSAHPFTYFLLGNVCLFMGLSMLGVYQLPVIGFHVKNRPQGGGYGGCFILGLMSGLIVGPCTAPILAAVLYYVASKQNIIYGFLLLFVFGYGVGFLTILLGSFTGLLSSIPKSGPWLENVKKVCGWVLIFAAEYFLIKMGGFIS